MSQQSLAKAGLIIIPCWIFLQIVFLAIFSQNLFIDNNVIMRVSFMIAAALLTFAMPYAMYVCHQIYRKREVEEDVAFIVLSALRWMMLMDFIIVTAGCTLFSCVPQSALQLVVFIPMFVVACVVGLRACIADEPEESEPVVEI